MTPLASPSPTPVATLVGVGYGLAAALFWALYVVGSRAGLGAGLDAWDLTTVRFTVAGLVFAPLVLRDVPGLTGVGWRRGAILAAGAGAPFSLAIAGGFALTPLAHGATINPAVVTLGSLALAALVLGERLGAARLAGVALVLGGLVLVTGLGGGGAAPDGRPASPWGDLLFVVSGLLWAGYTLNLRRWAVPPVTATAIVSVLSAAVMLPSYLVLRGVSHVAAAPGAFALQVLVQGGLAGVGATLAYSSAVRALGAARAGVFPSLVPAVAVLLGIPLLGEWPDAVQAAGIGVASLGLVMAVGVLGRRR